MTETALQRIQSEKNRLINEKQKLELLIQKILEEEKLEMERKNPLVSLKSYHNFWLCFDKPQKGSKVIADRIDRKSFETHELVCVNGAYDYDRVQLKSPIHNTYLCADNKGIVYQVGNANDPNTFWKLEVVSTNVNGTIDKCGLLNINSQMYLCAENNIFYTVIANRTQLKNYETWTIITDPKSQSILQYKKN